jgi:hypothetical protein
VAAGLLLGGVLLPAGAWAADKAEKKPWVQLPLDALGFPGVSSTVLAAGSSVLTVNFVDSSHLLVTYELRKLVPRVDHDPEDHADRLVAGEIVDLPDGHIEARTEWHMHDHGRYLWNLGGGRFLLRIGERLYTMAPLSQPAGTDMFLRTVFPSQAGRPTLIQVSDDGGVVTVETVVGQKDEDGRTKVILGDQDEGPTATTLIDFFRIAPDGESGGFVANPAGHVGSASPVLLPIDADGYLWATQTVSGAWAVTFDGFAGKTIQVGTIQSSCYPRLVMTSRSEFVALTCQGSDDRIKIASYGLDGTDTWEESVGDFGRPNFAFAPAAARFAISGTDSGAENDGTVPGGPPQGARQEVRVYQNASGDLLLHVDCSPGFKTAENFDLSADGMLAAVVRNGAIAIYKLPPLTKKDRDDMAEIAAYAPPATMADVSLKRIMTRVKVETAAVAVVPAGVARVAETPAQEADPPPGPGQRKPPTLLYPGEKPEFGSANTEPN